MFPDLPSTSPTATTASNTSITTLPTGLTVVTEDASTTSTITLTYPSAGSSSESIHDAGAALANKCLAFKSGSGLSSALILRTLENGGACTFSEAGRSGATVGFTCAPDKMETLIPLLATECTFENWDMGSAMKTASVLAEEAKSDSQTVLLESLYSAAYGPQSNYGKSFYATDASPESIVAFRKANYGMNGAILSATGVTDHDAFVKSVSESLAGANPGSESEETEAAAPAYMGGETRVFTPGAPSTHFAIGFEGPASSSALRNVMKYCLSLSSSGAASGFTAPGLIGIYSSTKAASASTLLDSISEVLTSSLTDELVERAKGLAKAEALFALDAGSKSLASAMSASVLETGGFSASHTAATYDGITKAEVSAAMVAALKSNPSVAATGDIVDIPYQAAIAKRFS